MQTKQSSPRWAHTEMSSGTAGRDAYRKGLLLGSRSIASDSLWPHGVQHARLLCPSLSSGVCSNSCPLSQWCIQPSHRLSPPSPLALNLSQHRDTFQWVSSLVLEFQLHHQSFQWIFRINFLLDWLVWSPCNPRDSEESSPAPQFESINSVFSLLDGPTFTFTHKLLEKPSLWPYGLMPLLYNMLCRFVIAFLRVF